MEIITSPQNQWIIEAKKLHQKKYRETQGLFLVEGLRIIEEAFKGSQIEQVFFHESLGATERGVALLKNLSSKVEKFYQVSTRVLASIAETHTPQGIVAIVRKDNLRFNEFQAKGKGPLVVLDGIQEPGNLGTILRTLWAVGGEGMLCLEGTTDPYNSKAVRASMGGIFAVPVLYNLNWQDVCNWAKQHDYLLVVGDINCAIDYRKIPWQSKTIICIGNESRGYLNIPKNDKNLIRAKLPLNNGAESLNAAVAASILLYETIRNN